MNSIRKIAFKKSPHPSSITANTITAKKSLVVFAPRKSYQEDHHQVLLGKGKTPHSTIYTYTHIMRLISLNASNICAHKPEICATLGRCNHQSQRRRGQRGRASTRCPNITNSIGQLERNFDDNRATPFLSAHNEVIHCSKNMHSTNACKMYVCV